MNNQLNDIQYEMPLKELLQKIIEFLKWMKSQGLKIALMGLIGGVSGFFYAKMQPINYTAKTTFIVEDGKSSAPSLGGLASLAGQFGVDVGGSLGGGLFSGDNILLYFKSTSLAREVLMTEYNSLSKQSLADVYASLYGLKRSWEKNESLGQINFPPLTTGKSYTRVQDSLLQKIVDAIIKKQFSISKIDKKSGFIEVSVSFQNENLAKIYCDRIVSLAVEKYISIKTQRQKKTVDRLQSRVDSIANLLRNTTVSGASLQTYSTTMDINPLYKTSTNVSLETTLRDKSLLSAIFASVSQNLELAKFTLSQETPVIQIVDYPILPLNKSKVSSINTAIKSSFFFIFIATLILYVVQKIRYKL